ncbi:DUF3040 domain-containing protein [Streptomyces sp. NBC_00467]|uniref:DUF3040 domain-containing protein n=1 Tax=Streptomyces sp. NBC_00467 TaxID=2975752 RepID=UPI002E18B071
MDGAGLSEPERVILAEIERELRTDEALDRRLRTMRPTAPVGGAFGSFRGFRLATLTSLLSAVAVMLFVMAAVSSTPALLWVFAGVWVLTAVCLLQLACRWGARRLTTRRGVPAETSAHES